MVKAYYLDNVQDVTLEQLKDIGVQLFRFDVSDYTSNPTFSALRKEHSLNFSDVLITDNKDPNHKEKMNNFFEEHTHKEDEVRFFLSGGGFYDVRDKSDQRWIRIHGVAGDLIVLPAGIYHRFSNDSSDYAEILRLFVTSATWRPLNRSPEVDALEERKNYLHTYKLTITPPKLNAYVLDQPNKLVSTDYLHSIGVLFYKLDITNYETKLSQIRKERGYNYSDLVRTDPEHLPNYEEKIKHFFEEHVHKDEEIRFFLDGSGYFDVRGHDDEWIRIHAVAGDLLVLPAGIYHRFANDEKKYAKVMRLFAGSSPIWTPYNRSDSLTPTLQERTQFEQFLEGKNTPYNGLTVICQQHDPSFDFDRFIENIPPKNKDDTILLYFTASENPQTKQLWCPDARKAQPLVDEALRKVLNEDTNKKIYFIKFPIPIEVYKGNPDYYFRLHPVVKLTKIPTMALWKNGNIEKRLVEGELHELGALIRFINN